VPEILARAHALSWPVLALLREPALDHLI
jgi:hypothetical protein